MTDNQAPTDWTPDQELLDTLQDAQEKMSEAAKLLDFYVRETGDWNADTYVVAHLKTLIGGGNRFDTSVDDLIERVQNGEAMRRE